MWWLCRILSMRQDLAEQRAVRPRLVRLLLHLERLCKLCGPMEELWIRVKTFSAGGVQIVCGNLPCVRSAIAHVANHA